MSTIKAGTTIGTALVTEGDTTGQLVFQTNGTTTALTIGTNQTATFSGNVAVNGTLTASGGLPSLATPLAVVGNATAGAEIRLPEDTDNGANYVAIKAPNALAANLTLTLPTADGTNGQYLQTNGSGQLAFATVPTTAPGGTTGQVQINNAGAFGAVASGTNGQYLTSGGAGNPPTWTTPSAGALVLISSQTVSSATTYVTFSNVFTSTYDNYVIVYNNVAFNNSYGFSGGILQAQYQKSGSYVTSGYLGGYGDVWSSRTTTLNLAGTVVNVNKANSDFATSGVLNLYNVNNSTATNQSNSGLSTTTMCTFYDNTNGVITGIRFLVESTSTTIVQGNFYIYGIAKS
jgi:hypothetical protein